MTGHIRERRQCTQSECRSYFWVRKSQPKVCPKCGSKSSRSISWQARRPDPDAPQDKPWAKLEYSAKSYREAQDWLAQKAVEIKGGVHVNPKDGRATFEQTAELARKQW